MKKIVSLFTLFVFFIIGFVHNSMIVFAMENNMEINMWGNDLCCYSKSEDDNSKCIDVCCAEWSIDHWISSINNNFQKKVLKKVYNYSFIDLNTLCLYSLDNKSLNNKTSPPYYDRYIINYSYHTLIKIIKSNT